MRKRIGPYRLEQDKEIGYGQSASVHLAKRSRSKELVALKLFHIYAPEERVQKIFLREIEILQRLAHPNIISVLEAAFDNGNPYYTMKYAPGGNLRSKFPEGSRLSPEAIDVYVQQIAAALQHAHDCGIVHCDLKPENILIADDGHILLADFGIARSIQTIQAHSTQGPAGTARYMAPEQFKGRPDPASDQYALAILIYELLVGNPPFPGSDMPSLSTFHISSVPPPLTTKNPAISSELETVLFRALAKEPTDRFPTVRGFAQAFQQAIQEPTQEGHTEFSQTIPQQGEGLDEDNQREHVSIDFAFVTALPKERDALLKRLSIYKKVQFDDDPLTYYRGRIKIPKTDEYYEVVVVTLLGIGTAEAGISAMALIEQWRPENVIVVGAASGVPSRVALGDIVVADYVFYYELAKRTFRGEQRRTQYFPSDRLLYNRALAFAANDWERTISTELPDTDIGFPKVHFGAIASGDKVLADATKLKQLLEEHPHLMAIEMEGAGVARAVNHQSHPPRFLEVRGIYDYGDEMKNDKWLAFAAEAAAVFTIDLLHSRLVLPLEQNHSINE